MTADQDRPLTRNEKVLAMAQQDDSPAERDNARTLLAAQGMWPVPPSAAFPPDEQPEQRMQSASTWTMPGATASSAFVYGHVSVGRPSRAFLRDAQLGRIRVSFDPAGDGTGSVNVVIASPEER